jgi:hypothetical protein
MAKAVRDSSLRIAGRARTAAGGIGAMSRPMTRRLRSAVLALVLLGGGLAGIAALPASASALPGPIALDAPENGTGASPLIAYDPSTQTTYVAWTDPVKSAVDLCIVPAGASSCEGGTPVLLEDSLFTGANFAGPGGVVVLPGGEVAVIGNTTEDGTIAWISPAGGEGFFAKGHGLQNKGEPISNVSLFYTGGNAVALSSTDVALLDDYGDYFADTSLTSPAPTIAAPNSNQTTPENRFPRKALETAGPELAAEPAPGVPGSDIVVGVGDNYAGPPEALPGCLNKEGTGYGVSVGKVDGTSKAAGTLNAEGLPGYGVLACSAESPVLAQGGTDGIGLVEQEGDGFEGTGSLYSVDYRPFIATSTGGSFGAPVELQDVSHLSLGGVIGLDLSEDSATGVYTTWQDGQGLVFDYSANGGAGWEGPIVVPEPASGVLDNPVVAGIGGGSAEVAFVGNPGTGAQVFLQRVNYQELAAALSGPPAKSAPAADTVATVQTSGSSSSASLEISAGTIGETDRATIAGANGASATGTVSYALYSSPSCTAGSKVFSGGSVAVSGGVAAASAGVSTALAPGVYYWQASYSGDANNLANASVCGSEVLTVVPAASIGGSGSSNGTTVTLTITCSSTPCTVTVTITISEAGASAARKGKKHSKPKIVTLASGTFTIHSAGSKKLQVRLTKAGRKLLAAHHGHLTAKVLLSEKTAGGIEKVTKTIKITTAKGKKKKK